MLKKIEKTDIVIFLIPFFVYLVALTIYYPGILSFDSYNQLGQISSGVFTPGHPIIHTLIEMLCMKVYNSPASIAMLQIFVFSLLWTVICKYNRKTNSSKIKIIEVILTLFITLNPINSIMSITLWKDVLYSYLVLGLTFLIEIFIDRKFKLNNKYIVLLAFVLALLPNLRYNGLSIFVGMLSILFIILLFADFKSFNYLKLVVLSVVFYVVLTIPAKVLVTTDGVIDSSTLDSRFMQITGIYLQKDLFTEEEINKISNYFDVEELKEYANPYFMDPMGKVTKNIKYLNEHRSEFYKLVIGKSIKKFGAFVDFELRVNSISYTITPFHGSIGTIITTNINAENKDPNINHIFSDTKIYELSNKVVYGIHSNPIIRMGLYMPGTYLWLGIILVLSMASSNKKWLLLAIPNLLNVAGLALLMPVQDVRYVYANILVGSFILLVYFIKRTEIQLSRMGEVKRMKISKPKVLLIIPAYNEEESIEKTVKTIIDYNKKNKTSYDYIVINDGSKDSTESILVNNKFNHIRLIHNLGIGGAVQTGYKYALENGYDIAIQYDGDGQHDVSYVKDIIKPIQAGNADMVIGSRFVKEVSKFKSTYVRRIGINLISFVIKFKTDKKIYDTTSGFRACNRSVIELFASIYPQEYPEPISTVNVLKHGLVVDEVAVKMNAREAGTSSIKAWKSVYYMINVILSIILLKKVK